MRKRMIHFMKQLLGNTLATTALSIILLSIISLIMKGTYMGLLVPLEILLANLFVHVGCVLFDKIDMKYRIFNYTVMLIYLLGILIGFCFLFDWCKANELWIICLIGILVFIVAFVIDLIKIKQDANEINSCLTELRKQKNDKNEMG